MIKFLQGDLLQSDAEALVNAVNTVGVMGKGIALQFKNQYPENYKVYKAACNKGALKVGSILIVKDGDLFNQKFIVNFPTKQHWRAPSEISYIQNGLVALKMAIKEYDIHSIAIPPLGCGNGGLDWNVVKPMIIDALQDLDINIYIYEPG
ncbi:macro domain-containing protein [Sphingobacterium faecium]|uniref:type II toxin-antitoxin system antitoxin DNA ADP-ribosyl glycohydrolase DarG n=1 Tax=Sphingobacterium faecium TaxID=34087 RepID=UPI0032081915